MIKSNKTDVVKKHQKGKLKRQEKRGPDQFAHSRMRRMKKDE